MASVVKLGEALVQAGLIDEFQLKSALGQQRKWGGRIGKALIDLGFLDEGTLIKFLSEKLKFSAVDLSRSKIAAKTFQAVPKRVAEKYMSIPVVIKETPGKKTLVLAMAEPTDLKAIDEIEFLTNFKIEPVVALESAILNVLKHYGQESAPPPPEDPKGITLFDAGPKNIELVQGKIQQMADVQAEFGAPSEPAAQPAPPQPIVPPPPPEPGAEVQGESEFDFSKYSSDEIEEQAAAAPQKVEDDAPLEMAPVDGSHEFGAPEEVIEEPEVIEEAETLDDTKPPILTPPIAAPLPELPLDPTNFLPPEKVADAENFFETPDQPAGITAPSPQYHVEEAETIEQAEEIAEAIEHVESEPVIPEAAQVEHIAEAVIDPVSEMAEAVAVAEPVNEEAGEVAEAEQVPEESFVAEAVPVEQAVSVDAQHSAVDAFWSTEPIMYEAPAAVEMMAESTYDEPVAEAIPHEEAATTALLEPPACAEPQDYAEPQVYTEPQAAPEPYDEHIEEAVPAEPEGGADIESRLQAIHTKIWEMKQRIENFITLFALKEQGKISLEEFLEELRKQ